MSSRSKEYWFGFTPEEHRYFVIPIPHKKRTLAEVKSSHGHLKNFTPLSKIKSEELNAIPIYMLEEFNNKTKVFNNGK